MLNEYKESRRQSMHCPYFCGHIVPDCSQRIRKDACDMFEKEHFSLLMGKTPRASLYRTVAYGNNAGKDLSEV